MENRMLDFDLKNSSDLLSILKELPKEFTGSINHPHTATLFRQHYGISLYGAPHLFSKHGYFWRLNVFNIENTSFEWAHYIPTLKHAGNLSDLDYLDFFNPNIITPWDLIPRQ